MIVKLYRMKRLEIKVPIFDQTILVLKADDIASIDDYIVNVYDCHLEFAPGKRDACTYTMPTGEIVVGLLPGATDRVIVHELSHATFSLLETLYIDPTKDQETFCYILDYLFSIVTK